MQARAAIKAGKLADVAERDELTNIIRQKRAFQGWQEGPLSFPPTFKFRRGTDVYLGAYSSPFGGKNANENE